MLCPCVDTLELKSTFQLEVVRGIGSPANMPPDPIGKIVCEGVFKYCVEKSKAELLILLRLRFTIVLNCLHP
jgi:hypothetical protein